MNHWLRGTSYIAYQAPDTPNEPEITAQGDPHGDEVLEKGFDTPETPEPETPETPEVVAEVPPKETPTPEIPPAKTDWKDKELGRRKRRIEEEAAKVTAAEARAKAAEELVASLSRQATQETPEGETPPVQPRQPQERVYTQAELDSEATRRAQAIAQQTVFQNDFASAVESANKQFGKEKVNGSIAQISEMGGLDPDHLNHILATDDPGKVIFKLGAEPEEYYRIMELPFNKRVVEFTKMGMKSDAPPAKRPSGAPPPVEPIGGSGGNSDNRYNDKADDAAWFAQEEKRSAAAWKKKNEGWRG